MNTTIIDAADGSTEVFDVNAKMMTDNLAKLKHEVDVVVTNAGISLQQLRRDLNGVKEVVDADRFNTASMVHAIANEVASTGSSLITYKSTTDKKIEQLEHRVKTLMDVVLVLGAISVGLLVCVSSYVK